MNGLQGSVGRSACRPDRPLALLVAALTLLWGSAQAPHADMTAPELACGEEDVRALLGHPSVTGTCSRVDPAQPAGPGCHDLPPPACFSSALSDLTALVGIEGAGAEVRRRPALRAQHACQRTLGRASRRYLAERLGERLRGRRSQLRSQRDLLRALQWACSVRVATDPSGSPLPRLGTPCAGSVAAPGGMLDPAALTSCLRPALGRIVDSLAPRPLPSNVVVIMTDDQRWDTLEYMPRVRDRLVAESVTFTESFVTTSLCCPARASFFTGRLARHTGIRGTRPPQGGAPLFDDQSSIVVALQRAGYATALFGKYMNANDLTESVPAGWDTWHAFVEDGSNYFDYALNEDGAIARYGHADEDYSTDLMAARSLAFIEAHADRPFFVHFAPYAPHFDESFFSTTPAPRHVGAYADLPPWRPESHLEADISDKPKIVHSVSAALWEELETTGEHDRFRIQQLESLLAVDEAVDALLDALERLGLADDTLVIFTSDNGYMWGEHRLTGKNVSYEESIRVPLVIRHPKRATRGTRDAHLVTNLDLAPTILELAGISASFPMDGRSLVDLLDGQTPDPAWREDFMGEHWRLPQTYEKTVFPLSRSFYVRSAEWKYIEHRPFFAELYHLPSDPLELSNLVDQKGYKAEGMSKLKRLRELLEEADEARPAKSQ